MKKRDRLEEDFSYIRSALERQRRWVCEHVPVWFAGLVGLFLIVRTGAKDLAAMGYLSPQADDWIKNVGWIFFVGLLVILIARRRRKTPNSEGGRTRMTAAQFKILVLPFILYFGGLLMLTYAAGELGLAKDTWRPCAMIYTGISFALIGLDRLNVILWFGYGILAGAAAMVFLPLPFPFTVLGLATAAGLVFGAWRDRQVVKRLSTDG